MFMRVDTLQAELPPPKKADQNAAAALQKLMGSKYGEMSTLTNGDEQALPGDPPGAFEVVGGLRQDARADRPRIRVQH